MKLSDAILLGRHLVKPSAAPFTKEEMCGKGCALTMAAKASGAYHATDTLDLWPWLNANGAAVWCDIARRFDLGVMSGEITLEQLVDYVRSIEPAEQEPCEDDEISDVRPELEVYRNR